MAKRPLLSFFRRAVFSRRFFPTTLVFFLPPSFVQGAPPAFCQKLPLTLCSSVVTSRLLSSHGLGIRLFLARVFRYLALRLVEIASLHAVFLRFSLYATASCFVRSVSDFCPYCSVFCGLPERRFYRPRVSDVRPSAGPPLSR